MKKVLAVVLVSGLALLSGCGLVEEHKSKRGRGDAPVGRTDDTPATVLNMPDNFPNVAFKCVGGKTVWVTQNEKMEGTGQPGRLYVTEGC